MADVAVGPISARPSTALPSVSNPVSPKRGPNVDFADSLASAITSASDAEAVADQMATDFAEGKPNAGIHETIIAAEKANVQVRFAVTLKNKLLDAYRELMNTQV